MIKLFAKNVTALMLARFFELLSGVLIVAIVARYLGPELYGEYGFITTFVTLMVVFTTFGLERITIREIAINREKAATYLGTAFIIRWALSVLVTVLTVVIITVLHYTWEAKIAVFLTLISQFALASVLLYTAMFKAFERMGFDTLIALLSQGITLAMIVVAVRMDLGFLSIFAVLAITNIVRLLVAVFIARRWFVRPSFHLNPALLKMFFNGAVILGLNVIIVYACLRVDIVILKAMSTEREVSMFYAPHSILLHLQNIPVAIVMAFFPFMSRSSSDNKATFSAAYEKIFKYLLIASILITIGGYFLSHEITMLVFGPSFSDAVRPFQVLILATPFLFLHTLMSFSLVSNSKQLLLIPSSLIALLCNVVLDLIMIPSLGAMGASIASLISYGVIFLGTFYMVSREVIAVPLVKTLSKPVAASLAAVLGIFLLKPVTIYLAVMTGGAIYIVTLFLFRTFSQEEIMIFKKILNKVKAA